MHAEIELVAREVIGLYERKRAYLAEKPRAVVEELLHRAEDELHSPQFSIRTAAEINRTACVMVLGLAEGGKR